MYDPHTRDSRGFGFVTMETPEEAEAAITALNATQMNGKTITVERVSAHRVIQVKLRNSSVTGASWPREDSYTWKILRAT